MFAFRVKNWARPLGLRALNLPCQLMGTGMAFPWEVISSANLATGAAVEDLEARPRFGASGTSALVLSLCGCQQPVSIIHQGSQKSAKRWEQGHIGMIVRTVPGLIWQALFQGNFGLLALTLDVAVPPVTLLGMLIGLMLIISASGLLFGLSSSALIVSTATLSTYVVAVLLCWLKFGLDALPLNSIFSIAHYVGRKFLLYTQIFSRDDKSGWIRTDRSDDSGCDSQESPK